MSRKSTYIVSFLIIALFLALAAGSGSNKSDKTNAGAQPTTPAELSKEGVSSDVKISVQKFESSDTAGNNQFSTKKAQGVYKIVTLSITNNQKDAITVDGSSFKLLDSQSREFSYSSEAQLAISSSTGNQKKEVFSLKQINPGMTVTGVVVFDVPKDAQGFVLKARGGMTGQEIKLKVED
jgi:hypothetical protein